MTTFKILTNNDHTNFKIISLSLRLLLLAMTRLQALFVLFYSDIACSTNKTTNINKNEVVLKLKPLEFADNISFCVFSTVQKLHSFKYNYLY